MDSQTIHDEINRFNKDISGWPQFHVHFFDKIKQRFKDKDSLAMECLRQDSVLRIPRDIESFLFHNKLDLSSYQHNKNLTNATQSQQYIMDLID